VCQDLAGVCVSCVGHSVAGPWAGLLLSRMVYVVMLERRDISKLQEAMKQAHPRHDPSLDPRGPSGVLVDG
jgi:hypothetical protein